MAGADPRSGRGPTTDMSCNEFSALVDSNTSLGKTAMMHLATCEKCKKEFKVVRMSPGDAKANEGDKKSEADISKGKQTAGDGTATPGSKKRTLWDRLWN